VRIEWQTCLEQGVEENTERPGICGPTIVRLAHDNFWGSVILGTATRLELLIVCYASRKPEICEVDDRITVGHPVNGRVFQLCGSQIYKDV
jgi:hypothetical protein